MPVTRKDDVGSYLPTPDEIWAEAERLRLLRPAWQQQAALRSDWQIKPVEFNETTIDGRIDYTERSDD